MVDTIHVCIDPAGNIKPNGTKSTEKIDGVVATIMAFNHAIRGGGNLVGACMTSADCSCSSAFSLVI